MKIETLEYIHLLLQDDEKTKKDALDMARKNYHSAEKDGTAKEVTEMKALYDRARARHSEVTEALADFEDQEF